MKRVCLALLLAVCWPCAMVCAFTKAEADSIPHEVRIGWGDMLFETAVWHNNRQATDYRYTGHIFAEYQYRLRHWLSVGMQTDYEQVLWTAPSDNTAHTFYNVGLLPTVRFTYFFSEYVNLYSALLFGLNINGGSETDMYGRKVDCSPAFGFTALGVSVGNNHWFGAAEIGGLNALMSKDEIYMIGSRLFTVSVGYRF